MLWILLVGISKSDVFVNSRNWHVQVVIEPVQGKKLDHNDSYVVNNCITTMNMVPYGPKQREEYGKRRFKMVIQRVIGHKQLLSMLKMQSKWKSVKISLMLS